MCGITGFFDFRKNASEQDVTAMAAAMPHRGPDCKRTYISVIIN